MIRSLLVLVALAALAGCSTTKFSGQVVSCADEKPLPEAKLSYKSTDTVNNNLGGSMPGTADKDGKFQANLTLAQGAGVVVTAEKDGYESKEQTFSSGADQKMCLAPKN